MHALSEEASSAEHGNGASHEMDVRAALACMRLCRMTAELSTAAWGLPGLTPRTEAASTRIFTATPLYR